MTRFDRLAWCQAAAAVVLLVPSLLRADGGYFYQTGQAANLAQTRQEALLAVHPGGDKVTYVVRNLYDGQASQFAWVLPVPSTPTDVVALDTSDLFDGLDATTRPNFIINPTYTGGGVGCACGCPITATQGGATSEIVHVEASGQAGVYDWAALTSTGSGALLDWLGANGYSVPTAAGPVLDGYIGQGMHFLAVRINENAAPTAGGQSEIPPIQFTVETTRRFYPMTISQISSAAQTEVILYLLAAHRAEAANLANGLIDAKALIPDYNTSSHTNYEQLFMLKIAELGGLALITEFASSDWEFPLTWTYTPITLALLWTDAPADLDLQNRTYYLTRLRTLIPRDRMTQDFEFHDAAADTAVTNFFIVTEPSQASAAAAQSLMALAVAGLFCGVMRWSHRRPAAKSAS